MEQGVDAYCTALGRGRTKETRPEKVLNEWGRTELATQLRAILVRVVYIAQGAEGVEERPDWARYATDAHGNNPVSGFLIQRLTCRRNGF